MTDFTETELAALAELAALIIPASEAHGVPGADDPRILAEIVASLGPRRDVLAGALAAMAELPAKGPEARGAAFRAAHPQAARIVQTVVAECYYRDVRVLASLGHALRPPFPEGHVVEQSDLSILDPVRAMPQRWRET